MTVFPVLPGRVDDWGWALSEEGGTETHRSELMERETLDRD